MRPPPELSYARVVLIADSPAPQRGLRHALESAGFIVQAFASPFLALAEIRRGPPDVVVLDWHLSEVNGYAVLERLRNACDPQKLRVLVLTDDVRLKVSPELAELMGKAVSPERFVERVSALAGLPAPSSQTRTA